MQFMNFKLCFFQVKIYVLMLLNDNQLIDLKKIYIWKYSLIRFTIFLNQEYANKIFEL